MKHITDQGAVHEHLSRTLKNHVGGCVGVVCTAISADTDHLHAQERAAVAGAVSRRRHEFATGRANARAAMAQIGEPPACIPSGVYREPLWPDHLTGSISHTDEACMAVVARRADIASIGIDLERDHAMEHGLWSTICTEAEADHVRAQPVESQGRWVTRLFSAKEAVYKWQFPFTGSLLNFQQVEIKWLGGNAGCRFKATLHTHSVIESPTGYCFSHAGMIMSWVCGNRFRTPTRKHTVAGSGMPHPLA